MLGIEIAQAAVKYAATSPAVTTESLILVVIDPEVSADTRTRILFGISLKASFATVSNTEFKALIQAEVLIIRDAANNRIKNNPLRL